MDYTKLISTLLSTSVITAGVIYIAKSIFDKFMEAKIEKYKTSLQKDTDNFKNDLSFEAEKFKHSLNNLSIEHQIRYSKLYEERGKVIQHIYNLLIKLELSLSSLTTVFQGPEWITNTEKENQTKLDIHELRSYLEYNRIFFNETLCTKIEMILVDSQNISVKMKIAKNNESRNQNSKKQGIDVPLQELLEPTNTWSELDEKVQKQIKSASLELAQEFRLLIGVS